MFGIGTDGPVGSEETELAGFSGIVPSDCRRVSCLRGPDVDMRKGSSADAGGSPLDTERYIDGRVSRRTVSAVMPAARSLGVKNLSIQFSDVAAGFGVS